MRELDRGRRSRRGFGALRITAFAGAGIALSSVVSLVIGAAFNQLFEARPIASSLIAVVIVGFLAWLFFYWQYDGIERLVRSRAVALDAQDLPPRKFLITGFSKIMRDDLLAAIRAHDTEPYRRDIDAICGDEKGMASFGSWQQNLRLIRFLTTVSAQAGQETLPTVHVIDNDTGQYADFKAMLMHYFPGIEVSRATDPKAPDDDTTPVVLKIDSYDRRKANYEDYQYVSTAFDRAFDRIARDSNLSREEIEDQVYIDVTPGFKIFSIAAAIQTLNRRALFLYVTSFADPTREKARPGGYAILGYDAFAEFGVRGG